MFDLLLDGIEGFRVDLFVVVELVGCWLWWGGGGARGDKIPRGKQLKNNKNYQLFRSLVPELIKGQDPTNFVCIPD